MKKIIFVILMLFYSTLFVFADSIEPAWQKVDEDNYIASDSISGLENVYGYSFLLKSYNKGQYEPVNGKKILYTLSHYELDCSKKLYKIGLIDSYDKSDAFVNGDYNRYAVFRPVVQGSAVGMVFTKLCRVR